MLTLLDVFESNNENKAINVIRNGLNLSNGKTDFWDNFLSICQNSSDLGELLDVSPQKIIKWSSIIKDLIEKIKEEDSISSKDMIKTGIN